MKTLLKSAMIATTMAFGTTTLALSVPAFAADEINLNTGVAVQGYDVVSYRTDAGPQLGSDQFTATFDGATYRFASEANLDTFNSNPARYVPAYGGFCAYGVAKGKKFEIDPTAYSVVDDVLYLNFNKSIQKKWNRKQAKYIDQAEDNWTDIRSTAVGDL